MDKGKMEKMMADESLIKDKKHEAYMRKAIALAKKAQVKNDVPVGALIVYNDEIIATGYNYKENTQCALDHAEIRAIKKASKKIASWRLIDCDIYITLEPCPMCAGAIIQSRLRHVYFGAYDYKAGCASSVLNILTEPKFNHRCSFTGGILQEECAALLKNYFASKRKP